MVDGGGQEVFGGAPVGGFAVEGAGGVRVLRQMVDEDAEPAGGEVPSVPVQEVYAVVAEQVGFESLGVFGYEPVEAEPSPRPRPVSVP